MNRFLKPPDRVLDSFSNSEKMVYDYLLENLEDIETINISTISRAVYVSPATVFNLLKKTGYSGFKEFKFEIQNYVKDLERFVPKTQIKRSDFEKITGIESFISTCKSQDFEEIKAVCEKLNSADRILVIANEITRYVAMDFTYRIQLCNVNIIDTFDPKQYTVMLAKKSYDYVIVFSKFGNTERIINALDETSSKIDLLITTNDDSHLMNYASTALIGAQTIESNLIEELGDISSRVPLFILADMIVNTYVYLFLSRKENDEEN